MPLTEYINGSKLLRERFRTARSQIIHVLRDSWENVLPSGPWLPSRNVRLKPELIANSDVGPPVSIVAYPTTVRTIRGINQQDIVAAFCRYFGDATLETKMVAGQEWEIIWVSDGVCEHSG